MSDISGTDKRGHNILELFDILTNFSCTTSENRAWLLVIKLLYTSCHTTYRTT